MLNSPNGFKVTFGTEMGEFEGARGVVLAAPLANVWIPGIEKRNFHFGGEVGTMVWEVWQER